MSEAKVGSVMDYGGRALLRRAVENARSRNTRKGEAHPRWTAIASLFGLGSTYSKELCKVFGLDPDEEVRR